MNPLWPILPFPSNLSSPLTAPFKSMLHLLRGSSFSSSHHHYPIWILSMCLCVCFWLTIALLLVSFLPTPKFLPVIKNDARPCPSNGFRFLNASPLALEPRKNTPDARQSNIRRLGGEASGPQRVNEETTLTLSAGGGPLINVLCGHEKALSGLEPKLVPLTSSTPDILLNHVMWWSCAPIMMMPGLLCVWALAWITHSKHRHTMPSWPL